MDDVFSFHFNAHNGDAYIIYSRIMLYRGALWVSSVDLRRICALLVLASALAFYLSCIISSLMHVPACALASYLQFL
jgi:hypothetical protein